MEGIESPSNYECARYGTYPIWDPGQWNSDTKPDMPRPGPMQRFQRNNVLQFWDITLSYSPSSLAEKAVP